MRLLYPGAAFGPRSHISPTARIMMSGHATIVLGSDSHVSPGVMLRANNGSIYIGSNVFVGQNTVIACAQKITIGNDVLIAENVTIRDQNHGTRKGLLYREQLPCSDPIKIGDNVWIGAGAVILKGIHVGDNAIIGAGSVVTRDVSEGTVVAGVPAHVIRDVCPEEGTRKTAR